MTNNVIELYPQFENNYERNKNIKLAILQLQNALNCMDNHDELYENDDFYIIYNDIIDLFNKFLNKHTWLMD